MKKWMQYEIIGETLDDAAGEAYDKVARMLGLPYPGGPEISKLAEVIREKSRTGEKSIFSGSLSGRARPALPLSSSACETPQKDYFSPVLPRPMLYSKNFNFSFSGLKTAVLYLIKKIGPLDKEIKSKIALEFENAVVETLIHKTKKAKDLYKAKTIMIGGGVACNLHLQRELKKVFKKETKLLLPEKELTGDNSIMIGMAGYLNYIKDKKKAPKLDNIKATGNLRL
jgi:N6-L-threonylcarbamoyladenine synthase